MSRPAQLTLAPRLPSVQVARRFVRDQCARNSMSAARRDDALLLTSELVTNAVLHGRSEVCLEVERDAAVLRVTVVDENSRYPQPVVEDLDALDGRGLALVASLARRWGVTDRPMGKAVWFELAVR